jgi:hypothetical protein
MAYKKKEDQRAAWRAWYRRNRKQENARAYIRKNVIKKKHILRVREIKAAAGCGRCGFNNPLALHFHHRADDKEIGISIAIRNGWSWTRIEKEIKKCTVLCANCHAIEHGHEVL